MSSSAVSRAAYISSSFRERYFLSEKQIVLAARLIYNLKLFPSMFAFHNFNFSFIPGYLGFALGIFSGLFLFWRVGRRELFESEFLLDFSLLFLLGALVFGRLTDFLVNYKFYHFSILKLLFINAHFSFDFYGAFLGAGVFTYIYALRKKENFWYLIDFAGSPLAMAGAIISLTNFLIKPAYFLNLYYFLGCFLLFLILKRLEKKKRHHGFFISFYLVWMFSLEILLFAFRQNKIYFANFLPYQLAAPIIILILVGVFWHSKAKRNLKEDVKSLLGGFLLVFFMTKRVLTNIYEADLLAKHVIFLPLYTVKSMCFFGKLLGREISSSFLDFTHALGFKK